jgi:dephospho-CoA kinase
MASDSHRPPGERCVIGITGRIGSGKTTVGKYLESKFGFQYLRYSEILAEWRAQDSDSKAHLQRVGWEVMAEGMQAELNRRLVARIKPSADVAVDGLRHPVDYQTLSGDFSESFRLWYIDSPPQVRFDRLNQKGKYADFDSFAAADAHPVEQHIDLLKADATTVVANEGTLQELYAAVEMAIEAFRKESRSL